jgi:hypothetical protein
VGRWEDEAAPERELALHGPGCHSVYEAPKVIDPSNDDDWQLWVGAA